MPLPTWNQFINAVGHTDQVLRMSQRLPDIVSIMRTGMALPVSTLDAAQAIVDRGVQSLRATLESHTVEPQIRANAATELEKAADLLGATIQFVRSNRT